MDKQDPFIGLGGQKVDPLTGKILIKPKEVVDYSDLKLNLTDERTQCPFFKDRTIKCQDCRLSISVTTKEKPDQSSFMCTFNLSLTSVNGMLSRLITLNEYLLRRVDELANLYYYTNKELLDKVEAELKEAEATSEVETEEEPKEKPNAGLHLV